MVNTHTDGTELEWRRCHCRILTAPLIAEYRRLTREISGHDPYVIHPRARIAVSGEDLKLCGPSEWVGDSCINMYMALLQARHCDSGGRA